MAAVVGGWWAVGVAGGWWMVVMVGERWILVVVSGMVDGGCCWWAVDDAAVWCCNLDCWMVFVVWIGGWCL